MSDSVYVDVGASSHTRQYPFLYSVNMHHCACTQMWGGGVLPGKFGNSAFHFYFFIDNLDMNKIKLSFSVVANRAKSNVK